MTDEIRPAADEARLLAEDARPAAAEARPAAEDARPAAAEARPAAEDARPAAKEARPAEPDLAITRVNKLRNRLASLDIDCMLLTQVTSIRWLTNWQGVFDDEPAHMLLIVTNPNILASDLPSTLGILKTDSRYSAAMRSQESSGCWQINDERIAQSIFFADIIAVLSKTGDNTAANRRNLRIGVEADITLNRFRALDKALAEKNIAYQFSELSGTLFELRATKDDSELELLRQAQAITDAAFLQLLPKLKTGISERQVASELEYLLRSLGGDGVSFATIAASGPNSALPHAIAGDRLLQNGDFLLLDFGASKHGYCADMTRTVVLGKASEEQRRIYDTVLAAQELAKQMIRDGVFAAAVADAVNLLFADAGFEHLTHGLGHGVGLDIHELPVLAASRKENKSDDKPAVLKSGNVVTVEPGIYLVNFGGVRIEDFGVVRADGFDCFTTAPRELIEL